MLSVVFLLGTLLCACGGDNSPSASTPPGPPSPTTSSAEAPTISASTANGAQNGAVIVTLSSATSGAKVYYTLDGSEPTTASQKYLAPILVASNLTIKAMATLSQPWSAKVSCPTSHPERWSGQRNFQTPAPSTANLTPQFGPTTSAPTAAATTNWRPTAPGLRLASLAIRRTRMPMSARMGSCTSSRCGPSRQSPFTRRRA
jgi:Chitobiase/beta-hexosaminidase C-terminal domain